MGKQTNQKRSRLRSNVYPNYPKLVSDSIKFLRHCHDPVALKAILRGVPESVLKGICNAVINVERGDVKLNPKIKQQLKAKRDYIAKLTQAKYPLKQKRQLLLNQKGGAGGALLYLLPTVISTVLGSLGNIFKNATD